MSFILDALKKSENERQRQSGPALFEVKAAPVLNRLPAWAIALVALLVVNLAVVAWLVLRGTPDEDVQATDAQAAANQERAASQPNIASTQSPAIAAPNTSAPVTAPPVNPSETAPAPNPAAPATAPQIITQQSMPAAQPPVSSRVLADVEPPAGEVNPEDYEPAVEPDVVAKAPVKPRGNETQVRRGISSSAGVPLYEELTRNGVSLPELRIDFHNTQPSNRFVFINMTKLREGETLPNGVRLEGITPEGAVLSYQGRRFLLLRE